MRITIYAVIQLIIDRIPTYISLDSSKDKMSAVYISPINSKTSIFSKDDSISDIIGNTTVKVATPVISNQFKKFLIKLILPNPVYSPDSDIFCELWLNYDCCLKYNNLFDNFIKFITRVIPKKY